MVRGVETMCEGQSMKACSELLGEEKAVLELKKLSRWPLVQISRSHLDTAFTFHFPEVDMTGSPKTFPAGKGCNIY